MEGYDTAQVCLNGHVVTARAATSPARRQNFCAQCGAATITACQQCGAPIRGHYHIPGVFSLAGYGPPRHCHNCGGPFPWTLAAVKAAQELASEVEGLSPQEREQLKSAIPELLRDSPQTQVATLRFKRLMSKAGSGAADMFRSILVDVVSEAVRKALWGPGA